MTNSRVDFYVNSAVFISVTKRSLHQTEIVILSVKRRILINQKILHFVQDDIYYYVTKQDTTVDYSTVTFVPISQFSARFLFITVMGLSAETETTLPSSHLNES